MEPEKKPNFFHHILLFISNIIPINFGVIGLIHLVARRAVLQAINLYAPPLPENPPDAHTPNYRRADARGNDSDHYFAGAVNTPFGRNMPAKQADWMEGPPPQVVAQKLLARRTFIPAGMQLNVMAAAWIQAMSHDWFGHFDSDQEVVLDEGPQCPLTSFRFKATKKRPDSYFDNFRTHWWDASFVYGQTDHSVNRARTRKGGKIHVADVPGRLPTDDIGNLVGDSKNGWVGVTMLQELFSREHNAVVDAIAHEHPELAGDDEKLFNLGRLVVAAVAAKIHTVDWTVELLKTDTLDIGMNANWFGLPKALGLTSKGPPGPFGLVAISEPENHGVPYCLTEEFVSVYRLHPLLPDGLPLPNGFRRLEDLVGIKGDSILSESEEAPQQVMDSLLRYPCGNLSLFNYPAALRNVAPTDDYGHALPVSDHVDLAALDIYRDRERGIRRYNEFRRGLKLKAFKNYDQLTGGDKEAIEALKDVYGADGIEAVDLQVGMLAEKKLKGFAISETAFVIFLLMASRRLEADRFFTKDFTEEVYTKMGKKWVMECNGLRDLLKRHWPEVERGMKKDISAFTPWEEFPTV